VQEKTADKRKVRRNERPSNFRHRGIGRSIGGSFYRDLFYEQEIQMKEYIRLRLKNGTEHIVTPAEGYIHEDLFPNINVAQEYLCMKAWLEANPSRRPTPRGINRFVTGWLIRAQHQQETPWRVRMEAAVGRRI